MQERNTENELRLSNIELNKQIKVLEKKLQEHEKNLYALQDSEKRYRRLFESAKDGILILDASTGKVVDVNPFLSQLLGYSHESFLGKQLWEIGPFKNIAASKDAFTTLQNKKYIRYDNLPLETADGRTVEVEFVSNVYFVDRAKVIQCNIRDVTERKRGEKALQESRELLHAILDSIPVRVFWKDMDLVYLGCNLPFALDAGFEKPEDLIGKDDHVMGWWMQAKSYQADDRAVIESGEAKRLFEEMQTTPSGEQIDLLTSKVPLRDGSGEIVGVLGTYYDITDLKQAEKKQLTLQTQLQQAQKLESIGRLAGGIAHDYNNMLSVILGYTELALDKVSPSESFHADLLEILTAARRSAEITQQLLAFARKQPIAPKALYLNEIVSNTLKMLRHLIGEDIDLVWLPGNKLWSTKLDPSQIEQVLVNLCINARDAIRGVGKITIETHMVTFDTDYCADNADFVPGEFVQLVVSDDGCGMDEETLDNIFEPFFTTKDPSQGTGLGLAVVYGIVKQNNGFINVYSEPGKGSTFTIYLPRHVGEGVKINAEVIKKPLESHGEMVLLVEDEQVVREMVQKMLERLGYQVLAAASPGEALSLAGEHADSIDLIISDLVMPEMNGRELADQLLALHPNFKVLFMSGYTSNVIADRGVLVEGVRFIQKPFSMLDLSVKIRRILDRK